MEWEFIFLNALQNIHTNILDKIMIFFSTLGEYGIIWIVISIALLFNKKTRVCGILAICALILNFIDCDLILKNIVERQRPCVVNPIDMIVKVPTSHSFPSGHTSSAFAVTTIILLFNKKVGIISLIFSIIIAFSRMYLYVHFPTDIIGGIVFGIINALIIYFVYKKFIKNRIQYKTLG